ncbi:trypsin-like peptidase domain-containing protein [Prosthecobacter sp.]|uniref:S1C family serine protease n=1 Tax=Prosthecobacter sp. TaxID=1965333 RepID=UPI001E0DD3B1|nr:trypsin-like peptidase domain-containing protein [Prosthecobacter sp.]MCB1276007.1 trypsin-like peptidase domain-containing protein [Prosthecobacter sp.]
MTPLCTSFPRRAATILVAMQIIAASALAAGGTDKNSGSKTDVAALLKVQSEVQKLLPQVRPALVAIQTGGGTASGVIISPDGLLLTAAHVPGGPGKNMRVVLEDGSVTTAQSLGLDKTTDAALAQLKKRDKPWPYVNLSREVAKAQPGEWCFALGHPGGFDKARGPVLRVGKIIKQTANSLHSDCVLMGGDSGGPLFNFRGEVIGIHSQIWEGRDQNVHVSMAPFLRSWDAMQKSQVIRVWGIGAGGYLGVATVMSDNVELEVADVIDGSPALKAGIRTGDVILSVDGDAMTDQQQFSAAVRAHAAGDTLKLKLRSNSKEREVSVKLAQKPQEEGQ